MDKEAHAKATADLRARIEATPTLPFDGARFTVQAPAVNWKSGLVSWLAVDDKGTIYELQRGEEGDQVLALDRKGKVLRSWSKGDNKIPHSIRIDPAGNVWTVDAGASIVVKYSPLGEKLMTITVGEQPKSATRSTEPPTSPLRPTDLFITDGYGNAPDGKQVKQWGKRGSGPGEFRLPHAIQIPSRPTKNKTGLR